MKFKPFRNYPASVAGVRLVENVAVDMDADDAADLVAKGLGEIVKAGSKTSASKSKAKATPDVKSESDETRTPKKKSGDSDNVHF